MDFFCNWHRKSECDGISGLLKHFATTHNLSAPPSERIKNVNDFVKYVSEYNLVDPVLDSARRKVTFCSKNQFFF